MNKLLPKYIGAVFALVLSVVWLIASIKFYIDFLNDEINFYVFYYGVPVVVSVLTFFKHKVFALTFFVSAILLILLFDWWFQHWDWMF